MFIENKLILSEKQKQFVNLVLSDKFPWYFQIAIYGGDQPMMHAHTLMNRHESDLDMQGVVNSLYFDESISLFISFCAQNNISYDVIYRTAFNATTGSKKENIGWHIDHDNLEHKVFLLYLNDVSGGDTLIRQPDDSIVKVKPEKFKGIVFDGLNYHTHEMCDIDERRIVFVVTFK